MIIINPYKKGSKSARALKHNLALRGSQCFIGDKAPTSSKTLLVSWGNSDFGFDLSRYKHVVNHPSLLKTMTNKLHFFRHVGHTDEVPAWTDKANEAADLGEKVLARQKLEGSGGAGIVIWRKEEGGNMPEAPLYVKYENKTHEFRVHVARGLNSDKFYPLLVQRKIFKKTDHIPVPKSWEVRNHNNGFIFVRESGYPTPQKVIDTALGFMTKHFAGLHFAALDIIYHDKRNTAFVLEGNTAPGMEGQTIADYVEYFADLEKEARA